MTIQYEWLYDVAFKWSNFCYFFLYLLWPSWNMIHCQYESKFKRRALIQKLYLFTPWFSSPSGLAKSKTSGEKKDVSHVFTEDATWNRVVTTFSAQQISITISFAWEAKKRKVWESFKEISLCVYNSLFVHGRIFCKYTLPLMRSHLKSHLSPHRDSHRDRWKLTTHFWGKRCIEVILVIIDLLPWGTLLRIMGITIHS